MRIARIAAVFAVAVAFTIGSASAIAQSGTTEGSAPPESVQSAAADSETVVTQFATLKGIEAVPMASGELDAVSGLHIHFFDANGGIHFVGRGQNFRGKAPVDYDNDSPDNLATGDLVHSGYHGLCRAAPILITPGGNGLSQC